MLHPQQFLRIKQMNKKKPLFAFDLRIEKQIAKLCVYEDDFLEDVIERFSKLAKLSQNFHHKIKEKLQNQLRKLLSKQNCSQNIRDKIESFLEESKIIIVGVTQTQNYEPINQNTPFKALKENSFPQRRMQTNELKQILFQSQKISPRLIKYASKQILVQQQNQSSIQQLLQKYTQRQNINQLLYKPNEQYQRKPEEHYSHKRQDQITLETIRNNRIARSQQRQKRSLLEYHHQQPKNQYRNNYSASHYNKGQQQQVASYRSYKENHNKKVMAKQPSIQLPKRMESTDRNSSRQCLKRVYPQNNYNLSELRRTYCQNTNLAPSKSSKSFKYDGSNQYRTKFDYDKCMQAKGVSGGFKQNKKFTYLGQS